MPLRCRLFVSANSRNSDEELLRRLHEQLGFDVDRGPIEPSAHDPCDLAVLHLGRIPTRDALAQCAAAASLHPHQPVVAVCHRTLERCVAEIAASGVRDFLFEPCSDEELSARLRRVVSPLEARAAAREHPATSRIAHNLIGRSASFVEQVNKIPVFAACDASVLILGETGTGKEIFAQAIHYSSPRAARAWVAVNCGAIPSELIEDELFGHVRGAYTTAHASRVGLVAEAEGGSLFLDDVDCLPLVAQGKLLRFLQEREYRAVGSNALQRANIRVIAASNRDLRTLCDRGQFRQDLYFRLNVLGLLLPPLRDRRDDISVLATHFVRHFANELGKPVSELTAAALGKLFVHDWPGNVRELQHTIERGVVLARRRFLDAEDIDIAGMSARPDDNSLRAMKARLIENFERGYIEYLLSANAGNITHAARAAGKNRRAFFGLMRKYHISPERYRATAR